MHSLLSVLGLVMLCGLCQAWYNRLDNAVYGGGWTPDRRSLSAKVCAGENERCIKSYQCCPSASGVPQVCWIESKFGFGECKPRNKILDIYPDAGMRMGFLKAGSECKDSMDCADQCCRLKRMGRFGYKQQCGKPSGDACVFNPSNARPFYD